MTALAEAGEWFENDLQLAAELGKTLLERNRDLEQQLFTSQQAQYDQVAQIDLLSKQLETLRSLNDSRMRLYEDVDKTQVDLESSNKRLNKQLKEHEKQTKRLHRSVAALELKVEEHQVENDALKRQLESLRKNSSVDVSPDKSNDRKSQQSYEKKLLDIEKQFKVELEEIKVALNVSQKHNESLEDEVARTRLELQELSIKVLEEKKEKEHYRRMTTELKAIDKGVLCKFCGDKLSPVNANPDIAFEHDDVKEVKTKNIVRLKSGGSAFGSRESLHKLGLELEDENLYPYVNAYEESNSAKSPENSDTIKSPDIGHNLLEELENQYRILVKRYERMIETKRIDTSDVPRRRTKSRETRPTSLILEATNVGQNINEPGKTAIDFRSPLDVTEGHFDNGPPEYKHLFKEIFHTLRRSIVYENANIQFPDDNEN